jgi:tRNA G18 (ribose-2'-O)-methylase SpoU
MDKHEASIMLTKDANDIHVPLNPQDSTTLIHQSGGAFRLYLVIANIGKFQNVRAMVNAAIAFGCTEILLVGQVKNAERLLERASCGHDDHDDHEDGMSKLLRQFGNWKTCVDYMQSKKIYLIGVEIDETSQPLNDEYFDKQAPRCDDVGILLGNEGQGILPKYLKECSALIRIPQYGAGTASLNVNVATSIVLHRFNLWQTKREQQKQH